MSIIAEFRIAATFLFGGALAAYPTTRVDVEQHTADERGLPILFFWTTNDDGRFEAALADDRTVDAVGCLDETGGRRLYRVQMAEPRFYPAYRDAAAKILDLRYGDGRWRLRMRFPDRESFRTFTAYYDEAEVPFELEQLYHGYDGGDEHRFGLTAVQHETLVLAYEQGYFDQPRRTSLDELAARFDVSPQAVAGRLQRAHANLIANTLADDRADPGGLRDVR